MDNVKSKPVRIFDSESLVSPRRQLQIVLSAFLVFVALSFTVETATALAVTNTDTIGTGPGVAGNLTPRNVKAVAHDYRVDLNPNPGAGTVCGPTAAEMSRLTANRGNPPAPPFPGWTFNRGWGGGNPLAMVAGNDAPGNLNVDRYDAHVGDLANDVTVNFVPGGNPANPGLPNGWVLRWVQFVTTNDPLGAAPANAPYIDPYDARNPNSDSAGGNTPFYGMRFIGLQFPGGTVGIRFLDTPNRGQADAAPLPGGVLNWGADLYLAAWDQATALWFPSNPGCPLSGGAGSPRLSIGINWGFTITITATPGTGAAGAASSGGAGGDECEDFDCGSLTPLDNGTPVSSSTVGGNPVDINKLALLAPYIGFASVLSATIALTAIYVKRMGTRKTANE